MKLSLKLKFLPFITLAAGGIGMVLRMIYLSSKDMKGLYPAHHIADTASYLVFALALILIFLATRQIPNEGKFQKLFPAGMRRSIGYCIGAVTIVYTSLYDLIHKAALSKPAMVLGILAALSLLILSLCRFKGSRPTAFFLLAPVVYLMFHAVIQARLWSSETQASVLFYPFLASLFLLLNAYFTAALTVRQSGLRAYVFFNQATLLLCCISLSCSSRLFYLGMAAWVGLDLCAFPQKASRPQPEEES